MKSMNQVMAYKKSSGDIIKSNHLVEAKYDLTLIEQKLILMAISRLDISSKTNNAVSIKVRDFCNLIGSTQERYTEVREILRNLRKREIIITRYDECTEIKEELIAGWLNAAYYKNGVVELFFPEPLMPYLVELKEKYTVYNIKNIANISSKHAIRMYELMKENEYRKSVYMEYDKLKSTICGSDKFDRYYDFKKRVLVAAQEEIAEKCDICFAFDEVRKGKKVIGLEFKISKNNKILEQQNREYHHTERLNYYGDNDIANVVHKYRQKTKKQLTQELFNLMINKYEKSLSYKELEKYSESSLIKVIFGIVDGVYLDVKRPLSYFRKVLEKEENP